MNHVDGDDATRTPSDDVSEKRYAVIFHPTPTVSAVESRRGNTKKFQLFWKP